MRSRIYETANLLYFSDDKMHALRWCIVHDSLRARQRKNGIDDVRYVCIEQMRMCVHWLIGDNQFYCPDACVTGKYNF